MDNFSEYSYGLAMYGRHMYQRALIAFNKSLKIDPSHFHSWYYTGHTLGNLGRFEESANSFDQATKIDPNEAKAWLFKSEALVRLGKFEESKDSFNRAIRINSKIGQYLFSDDDDEWYSVKNIAKFPSPFSIVNLLKKSLKSLKEFSNYDEYFGYIMGYIWFIRLELENNGYDISLGLFDNSIIENYIESNIKEHYCDDLCEDNISETDLFLDYMIELNEESTRDEEGYYVGEYDEDPDDLDRTYREDGIPVSMFYQNNRQ